MTDEVIVKALTPDHQRYAEDFVKHAQACGLELKSVLCGYRSVSSDTTAIAGFEPSSSSLEIVYRGKYSNVYRSVLWNIGQPYDYPVTHWDIEALTYD